MLKVAKKSFETFDFFSSNQKKTFTAENTFNNKAKIKRFKGLHYTQDIQHMTFLGHHDTQQKRQSSYSA